MRENSEPEMFYRGVAIKLAYLQQSNTTQHTISKVAVEMHSMSKIWTIWSRSVPIGPEI